MITANHHVECKNGKIINVTLHQPLSNTLSKKQKLLKQMTQQTTQDDLYV